MPLTQNPYLNGKTFLLKDIIFSANKILIPTFLLYAVLIISGTINLEPWADEAQAWLLVRDNSIFELLKVLPAEGHPPLWYFLIYPLVKLGMPYYSVKFLTTGVSIISVYIFQFKTRLPLLLKALIPFSYIFLYQYSVFARSYCLVLLFIAFIISIYPVRHHKPWLFALPIAALFNTHVLVFSFCAGLVILFMIETLQKNNLNTNTISVMAFMCLGGGYLLPYLATHEMVAFFQSKTANNDIRFIQAIAHSIFAESSLLSVMLLLAFLLTLSSNIKSLFLAIIGLAGVLYILAFRYEGSDKHAGIIFIILIAICGIAGIYERQQSLKIWQRGSYILAFIILLQAPFTCSQLTMDLKDDYSASKETAEFIVDNKLYKHTIVAYWSGSASALLPYLPPNVKFYQAEREQRGTYQVYDSVYRKGTWMYPVDYAVKVAHDNFSKDLGNVVMLLNYPVQPFSAKYLDLIYQSSPAIRWDETFYIYKFKDNVR